jgi:hypothetical protein
MRARARSSASIFPRHRCSNCNSAWEILLGAWDCCYACGRLQQLVSVFDGSSGHGAGSDALSVYISKVARPLFEISSGECFEHDIPSQPSKRETSFMLLQHQQHDLSKQIRAKSSDTKYCSSGGIRSIFYCVARPSALKAQQKRQLN